MTAISKKVRQRLQAEADRERAREQRLAKEAADLEASREAEITRLIEETGWAVCVADSDDPADPAPHFGYTIGRTAKGHPELCAWGHNREDLQTVLNLLGAVAEKQSAPVSDGDVITVPMVGVWHAMAVPAPVMGHLEYARRRYTFIRAIRMRRIG